MTAVIDGAVIALPCPPHTFPRILILLRFRPQVEVLKRVRVNLEKLRTLCERLVRRILEDCAEPWKIAPNLGRLRRIYRR